MGQRYIIATDPRDLPVDFSDSIWEHINKKHEDLKTYRITTNHIKNAIQNPFDGCIYESKKYTDCSIYYGRIRKRQYLLLRVVVHYVNNVGDVKTAHLCSTSTYRGNVIWQKPRKLKQI